MEQKTGFGSHNEIEMFDVLSNILKFEFEDMVKTTADCYPDNEDLTNARKELLIFLMQCKDKSELNELSTNSPLVRIYKASHCHRTKLCLVHRAFNEFQGKKTFLDRDGSLNKTFHCKI